jgi:hypothetical protein
MDSTQHSQSSEGTFDALGNLAPDAFAGLSKWWMRKGKPAFSDVASSRAMAKLGALDLGLEHCGPRLA